MHYRGPGGAHPPDEPVHRRAELGAAPRGVQARVEVPHVADDERGLFRQPAIGPRGGLGPVGTALQRHLEGSVAACGGGEGAELRAQVRQAARVSMTSKPIPASMIGRNTSDGGKIWRCPVPITINSGSRWTTVVKFSVDKSSTVAGSQFVTMVSGITIRLDSIRASFTTTKPSPYARIRLLAEPGSKLIFMRSWQCERLLPVTYHIRRHGLMQGNL